MNQILVTSLKNKNLNRKSNKNKFPITPISLPFLFRQAYGNHIFKVLYTFLLHKALRYYPLALHSC